jgi:hypothetical protein
MSEGAYLPPRAEQEAMVDALGELIARAGQKPLLERPLLEPTDACFPDRFTPDERGVGTLARRLLSYACLETLVVDITLYDNPDNPDVLPVHGIPRTTFRKGAAAWFAGIAGDRCYFGADRAQAALPEAIVGTLCHEVAHAWRTIHGLSLGEEGTPYRGAVGGGEVALEEKLTDLTTIFLGFGIFTVNNAYRYRSAGDFDGVNAYAWWSHSSTGYLSPQAMSYPLAMQCVARGMTARQRRHVAGLLQAVFFQHACKHLLAEAPELTARLGIRGRQAEAVAATPPPVTPFPTQPSEVTAGEGDDPGEAFRSLAAGSALERRNQGRTVFQVRRTDQLRFGMLGAVAGLGLALALWAYIPQPLTASLAMAGGGLLAGRTLGRRRRRDFCSDPSCEALLGGQPATCPGCGGSVRGLIDNRNERLSAEEAQGARALEGRRRQALPAATREDRQ